jgi:hypothetical protein
MSNLGNLGVFNVSEVEEKTAYEPIPVGWYSAFIEDSEMKDTRSGGEYLSLTFIITEGKYQDRKIFLNLNLVNSNEKAVEIARQDLGGICRAIGKEQITDSSELHDQPMDIKVSISPARGQYDAFNSIKSYVKYHSMNNSDSDKQPDPTEKKAWSK